MDKKSICNWLLVFYFLFSLDAANCAENHWGIKAGVPFGFYTGSSYLQYLDDLSEAYAGNYTLSPSFGYGFSIGAYYVMGLSDYFAIGTEIYYTLSNVDYSYVSHVEGIPDGYITEKMHFIEIPLLMKFNLNAEGKYYRFNFFLGPDLLFSSGDILLKNREDKKELRASNIPDTINKILLNALAGIEWYMYFTEHWYHITECRFSWGLLNQRTESLLPPDGDWKMHLLTVNIGFGYKI